MPSSIRKELKEMTKKDIQTKLEKAEKTLDDMRTQLIYMQFDVEATRRERDHYKSLAEKK